MDAHPADVDALLAEAGYLHALARKLARDPHVAEDLVQDTLATALEKPPRGDGLLGLRAWLSTVLRNRARRASADERDRRDREWRSAQPEAVHPQSDDVEERVVLQRNLAEAILALPEPYRSAVTLRWLDGLTPGDVARVQGVSPEAARQRLSRAVAMLRTKLDGEYGRRSRWCAIALGVPDVPPIPHVPLWIPGSIAMSLTLKMAAVSAVALVIAALVLQPWNAGGADANRPEAARTVDSAALARDEQGGRLAADEKDAGARAAIDAMPSQASSAAIDRDQDLSGVVIDTAGKPVAGAAIALERVESNEYSLLDLEARKERRVVAETRSAADGTFVVRLPIGRPFALEVEAKGFAKARLPNRYAGEQVVVRLSRGAAISGVVLRKKDGSPVVGARVEGFRRGEEGTMRDPRWIFEGQTNAAGGFRFDGLPAARIYLQVSPIDEPSPRWRSLELVDGGDEQVEVLIDEGPTVRGKVIDAETREPIAGAEVGEGWVMRRTVRTDDQGEYVYAGFPLEGMYDFGVRAKGYGYKTVTVREPQAPFPERVDIALSRARRVSGRILDVNGQAIAGAYVAACASEHGDEQQIDCRVARSHADGRFEIEDVRPDVPHALFARKEGFGTCVYEMPASERESFVVELGDIVLQPMAVVRGTLVDEKGAPLPDRTVDLLGWNSDRLRFGTPQRPSLDSYVGERQARTDDLGRFAFADLAPGDYKVRTQLRGLRKSSEVSVHVDSGARVEGVVLVLPIGLSIEGRIADSTGRGVRGVYIDLIAEPDGPETHGTMRTTGDGKFELAGLPAGNYTITTVHYPDAGGPKLARARVRGIAAGTSGLEIVLLPSARLEGIVLDADGKPVEGAYVRVESAGTADDGFAIPSGPDGRFTLDLAEGAIVDLLVRPPWDLRSDQETGTKRVYGVQPGPARVEVRVASKP